MYEPEVSKGDQERVLRLYDEGLSENMIAARLLISRYLVHRTLVYHERLNGKYKYRDGARGIVGIIRNNNGVEQERIRYHAIYEEKTR